LGICNRGTDTQQRGNFLIVTDFVGHRNSYATLCQNIYVHTIFENPTLKALNTIAQGKRRSRATLGYEISNPINPVRVAEFFNTWFMRQFRI
jgi:hypothetical protein